MCKKVGIGQDELHEPYTRDYREEEPVKSAKSVEALSLPQKIKTWKYVVCYSACIQVVAITMWNISGVWMRNLRW
jgi:hypothetical protein